ncbi:MAG: hypothetical protein HYY37_04090 [Candidatus Aenigmarchaeota archaeon]|nr:hypothetical protein [Candidatus Aenigmarchaeota archaeon]
MLYHHASKEKSLKNVIISILASEHPLSARKIYILTQKQGFSVTYHAVYKALKQLSVQGVLEKEGKGYRIRGKWIKEVKEFGERLHSAHNDIMPSHMTFNSLSELNNFLLEFVRRHYLRRNKELCISVWNYFFWPLLFEKEGYSDLRKIVNKENIYLLCRDDSRIGKWCADFYKKLGMHVKIGVTDLHMPDCVIYRDTVIQIFWPNEIVELFGRFFLRTRGIEAIDVNDFFEHVVERKARFEVAVIENKAVAERVRNEILATFNGT